MALVQCKECGKEISKKAEACPNCGAKPKKKTSVGTWIILFVILIIAIPAIFSPSNDYKPSTSSTSIYDVDGSAPLSKKKRKLPEIKTKPVPGWRHYNSVDEMSGKKSSYANSPKTSSTRALSFPYSGLTSHIGVGCSGSSKWAYFIFSTSPNLNNTQTEDGYSTIKTRIKWGEKLDTVTLHQDWGSDALHAKYHKDFISKLLANDKVMLELNWHSQDQVRFEYTLNGSSKAINAAFQSCDK